jgi:hypothetical protein
MRSCITSTRNRLILLAVSVVLFGSCAWELDFDVPPPSTNEFEIFGTVQDKHTRQPLKEVILVFSSGGWFSPEKYWSASTDSDGKYSLNVSGSGPFSTYIHGYFEKQVFIDAQQINCSTTASAPCRRRIDFSLARCPAIRITAKNTDPYDEADLLEITSASDHWLNNITLDFQGQVDTTILMHANSAYPIDVWKDSLYFEVTKNSVKTRIKEHYFKVVPGDTINYQIEY